jgi:hypothetical protein
MATEKTFQSGLPDLLKMFGEKQATSGGTVTRTATANTAPLQQVFDRASAGIDPQLYQQLIASIFQSAGQQVPQLTAALANATGSRSSSNSPLAMALQELNNQAAAQAAQSILTQQNAQQQIAANAAGGIANATRSETTTTPRSSVTTTPAVNPLLMSLVGFGANQLDKRGVFDKLFGKDEASSSASSLMAPMPSLLSGVSFGDTGGLGAVGDFGAATNFAAPSTSDFSGLYFPDLGSLFPAAGEISNMLGPVSDLDFFSNFGDAFGGSGGSVSDFFTSNADTDVFSNIDFGSNIEELPNFFSSFFADGGVIRNRNNMGAPLQKTGMLSLSGRAPGAPSSAQRGAAGSRQRGPSGTIDSVDANTLDDPMSIEAESAITMDAASGYSNRNAALATLGKMALGLVAAGALNPVAAQMMSLAGITKSPITGAMSLIKQGTQQQAQLGLQATDPVGGGNTVQPGGVAGMSLDPAQIGGLLGQMGLLGNTGANQSTVNMSLDLSNAALGATGSDPGAGPGAGPSLGGNAGLGGGSVPFADGGEIGMDGVTINGPAGRDVIPAKNKTPGGKSIMVEDGEIIIPRDTVQTIGQQFFENLIKSTHKPVRR